MEYRFEQLPKYVLDGVEAAGGVPAFEGKGLPGESGIEIPNIGAASTGCIKLKM